MGYRTLPSYRTFLFFRPSPSEAPLSDYYLPFSYQTMLRSYSLDEQGELSDQKKIFFLSCNLPPRMIEYIGMTTTRQTKGNEMATKLIGLTFALVIGTTVAINLISMFSDVTDALRNPIRIVLVHVDGN